MKRLILAGILYFGVSGFVDAKIREVNASGKVFPPMYNSIVTEAQYVSSVTCAVTVSSANGFQNFGVDVSSDKAKLYSIIISSVGTDNAYVELFDAYASTSADTSITGPLSANALRQLFYNVQLTSGIAIYNRGTFPACVTVIYAPE